MKERKFTCLSVLYIIETACLLFLLAGCFQKKVLVVDTSQWQFDKHMYSEKMELPAGVYQVRAVADFESDYPLELGLVQTGGNFRSLRGNPVSLSMSQREVEFEYYLLPGTKAVQLYCNVPPETDVSFEELTLTKLGDGKRILFVTALFWILVLDALIVLGQRLRKNQISEKKLITFCGLTGIVCLEAFALFTDYLILGESTCFYIHEIERIAQAGATEVLEALVGKGILLPAVLLRKIGFDVMLSIKTLQFLFIVLVTVLVYQAVAATCKRLDNNSFVPAVLGTLFAVTLPWNLAFIYRKADLGGFLMAGILASCWKLFMQLWNGVKNIDHEKADGEKHRKLYGRAGSAVTVAILSVISFQVVGNDKTPIVYICLAAAGTLAVGLLTGCITVFIKKRMGQDVFVWVLLLLVFLGSMPAMYRVNMVAFESQPFYLYTYESILMENE